MQLTAVLAGLDWRCTAGNLNQDVTMVHHDSRRIKPGGLFICLTGRNTDGRSYIPDALAKGARSVLVERPWAAAAGETVIETADARKALAVCCANWHGNPADALTLIGITGTNGKTTTAFFVESILRAAGAKAGLLGTVCNQIGRLREPARLTTPEPPELHELFLRMVKAGMDHCVMEVSSHALAQERIFGLDFTAGVFTNLSREHLEYHADMEEYLACKCRLIEHARCAVINRDDTASYRQLLAAARGPVIDYGLTEAAQVRGRLANEGELFIDYQGESAFVRPALPGLFNAYNTLAAAAATLALGCGLPAVARGLSSISSVPGRFEEIKMGQPFRVIVDYAHTPDGLAKFLAALRDSTAGRLILIIGARGGRDRGKRPLMGAIAARLTDYCYLTADSPNDEPLAQILADLEKGFLDVKRRGYEVVPDRKEAIRLALQAARPGDAVAATGRGHETEYKVGDEIHLLEDAEAFRELLSTMVLAEPVPVR